MTDQGEIVREVEAANRHYVDTFNRRDPIEISRLYELPHAQVIGGDVLTRRLRPEVP